MNEKYMAILAAMQAKRSELANRAARPVPARTFDMARFQANLPASMQAGMLRLMEARNKSLPAPKSGSGTDGAGFTPNGMGYRPAGPMMTDLARVVPRGGVTPSPVMPIIPVPQPKPENLSY